MIRFITETKSNILANSPLLDEAIIFATDTKELFIDVNKNRIQISDIVVVTNESDLNNILAPLNKFYYVEENNLMYKYINGSWKAITTTQAQYTALKETVDDLVELYEKITTQVNIEHTILASGWNGNSYTINNENLSANTTVRLNAPNLTDVQYIALSSAKIIPDASDIANGNLILRATGEVPVIDIPIIVSVFIDSTTLDTVEDNLTSTSSVNPLAAKQGRILNEKIGDLSTLNTTDKTNTVAAINELFQDVDNGKTAIASAITDKGIVTTADATYETMYTNIRNLNLPEVSELTAQITVDRTKVLQGEKYINDIGVISEGSIETFTESYSYSSSQTEQILSTENKYLTGDIIIEAAPLQEKDVAPGTESQTIVPDEGSYGLSQVNVAGDENLKPNNIREGVTIFGVLGTLQGAIENLVIGTDKPIDLEYPTLWLDTTNGNNILNVYDGTQWLTVRGTWA